MGKEEVYALSKFSIGLLLPCDLV